VEARLELNIYHLFYKLNLKLPQWLGEKIEINEYNNIFETSLKELLYKEKKVFETEGTSVNFLRTERTHFAESGVTGSFSVREYVYPSDLSINTVVTFPVSKSDGQIYIGLESRDLPVPQLHTGNSWILTVPAKRVPKTVRDMYQLRKFIYDIRIGNGRIQKIFKLGEKYYPSIGITPEQVYPYVICLDYPDPSLYWVRLSDALNNFAQFKDAHLLIAMARLRHALSK